jgi:hypothetical protein
MSPNECLIALEGFERAYSSALIWSQSVREGLPGFHFRSSGIHGIEHKNSHTKKFEYCLNSKFNYDGENIRMMVIEFAQ